MASTELKCANCGANLEVVGVTASVRETLLFIGQFGAPGRLQRISQIGEREVDEVKCRQCGAVQPAKFAEALQAA